MRRAGDGRNGQAQEHAAPVHPGLDGLTGCLVSVRCSRRVGEPEPIPAEAYDRDYFLAECEGHEEDERTGGARLEEGRGARLASVARERRVQVEMLAADAALVREAEAADAVDGGAKIEEIPDASGIGKVGNPVCGDTRKRAGLRMAGQSGSRGTCAQRNSASDPRGLLPRYTSGCWRVAVTSAMMYCLM